ncbi:hypothetical protein PGB34_22550 [Xenophilus arseniciresistens]|uniref:Uncharacterized protein n=1 Tax=Xenophilus arseniciresistens TaxID=1283306 RepID=A0AAE3NCQ7_9BURK|nr:hypothetical protein [Xenophilus arseniciresistens]MDA7419163.1 hypothetical protein [Xenophilus arseniciresistens]
MSTGAILTVLSNIPWGQVIDNAPKVAEGATRLWNSVGLRKKAAPAADADAVATAQPALAPTEALQARVQGLEAEVRRLSEQMQASSELIKALADQNAMLVQRAELNRRRLHQLAMASAAVAAALATGLLGLLLRG